MRVENLRYLVPSQIACLKQISEYGVLKSLKIAHVVPTYLPAWRYGGPIRSVHSLCRALVAAGHEVHVFTTNVNGDEDSDVLLAQPVDVDGVMVWYFPSKWLRRLYWSPALASTFNRVVKDFDVVHLHSVFLWPTMKAARAALHAHVPYILSPRGALVPELFRRRSYIIKMLWMVFFERFTIEHAAAIHATSQREANLIKRFGLRMREIYIVPNGIEMYGGEVGEEGVPKVVQAAAAQSEFIVFIGRISWEKGLDRLIQALPYLPNIVLVVAGNDESGYTQKLSEQSVDAGVAERVLFVGAVNGAAKDLLLKRAKVLVLPSYSENFGNVVLEAMAVGCPVVVSDEVGAAEVVALAGAGIVSSGEPSQLAESIRTIISNPEVWKAFSRAGINAVKNNYAWDKVAAQMVDVYLRISAKSGMH